MLDAMEQRTRRVSLAAVGLFFISAAFHYAGPSFAVLLFSHLAVAGVAWIRIASAALVFACWRRPWRALYGIPLASAGLIACFGATLAAMNLCFYLAIARLPLATVSAIEFLGPIALAANGARTPRNAIALVATTAGIATMTTPRLSSDVLGLIFAFANCALFAGYITIGHRLASGTDGNKQRPRLQGIDALAGAMLAALIFISPLGATSALPAFRNPLLLLAAAGVGICSSVIPYVTDQLAMVQMPRASFSLMMALLPAFAMIIGTVILHQMPSNREIVGIAFVAVGIALHRMEG